MIQHAETGTPQIHRYDTHVVVRAEAWTPAQLSGVEFSEICEVPHDQRYYWTREWQDQERSSRAELASGESMEFNSVEDAIRWLQSEDDE